MEFLFALILMLENLIQPVKESDPWVELSMMTSRFTSHFVYILIIVGFCNTNTSLCWTLPLALVSWWTKFSSIFSNFLFFIFVNVIMNMKIGLTAEYPAHLDYTSLAEPTTYVVLHLRVHNYMRTTTSLASQRPTI